MTPLLSIALGVVFAALSGLVLLALAAGTVLLILLALLALDHLLQRNGIDRRAGAGRAWSRLRGPERARQDPTAAGSRPSGDAGRAPAPRIPFSARRPGRPARPAEDAPTPDSAPAAAPVAHAVPEPTKAPVQTPSEPVSAAPAPAEAVTQVLPTEPVAPAKAAGTTTRAPRATAPRTRAPRATKPALRGPAAAAPPPAQSSEQDAPPASAPQGEKPADRDSAIDRLFAPLLESDRTEPLPRARAARRPDEDA